MADSKSEPNHSRKPPTKGEGAISRLRLGPHTAKQGLAREDAPPRPWLCIMEREVQSDHLSRHGDVAVSRSMGEDEDVHEAGRP